MSDESGRWEVYVRPFSGGEGRWQISTEGGWYPKWANDTWELFFRGGQKMMVASTSSTEDTFRAEPPRELFTVPTMLDTVHAPFDVTPDGQHFLVLLPQDVASPTTDQAILVLNWFEEIQRLVPTN
jgi:hypothetical protein